MEIEPVGEIRYHGPNFHGGSCKWEGDEKAGVLDEWCGNWKSMGKKKCLVVELCSDMDDSSLLITVIQENVWLKLMIHRGDGAI